MEKVFTNCGMTWLKWTFFSKSCTPHTDSEDSSCRLWGGDSDVSQNILIAGKKLYTGTWVIYASSDDAHVVSEKCFDHKVLQLHSSSIMLNKNRLESCHECTQQEFVCVVLLHKSPIEVNINYCCMVRGSMEPWLYSKQMLPLLHKFQILSMKWLSSWLCSIAYYGKFIHYCLVTYSTGLDRCMTLWGRAWASIHRTRRVWEYEYDVACVV